MSQASAPNKQIDPDQEVQAEVLPLFDRKTRKDMDKPALKRGRPAGSRNRRSKEAADFILEHYGDPFLNLAIAGSFGVEQLAHALGCSKLEAFKEWRGLQNDLMPFIHSKMPQAHHVRQDQVAPVTIVLPDPGPNVSSGPGLTINPINTMTYDADSERDPADATPQEANPLNSLDIPE